MDTKSSTRSSPFATQIAAYEEELDRLWGADRPGGGWRRHEPFARADVPTLRRLKWLLKRRDLLLQGKDWEVELVVRDPRLPHKVWAVPVPKSEPKADDPRAPASPLPTATTWEPPAATVLAFELRMPLATVEHALTHLPATSYSDDGVRSWCRLVHDEARRIAAMLAFPVSGDLADGGAR